VVAGHEAHAFLDGAVRGHGDQPFGHDFPNGGAVGEPAFQHDFPRVIAFGKDARQTVPLDHQEAPMFLSAIS